MEFYLWGKCEVIIASRSKFSSWQLENEKTKKSCFPNVISWRVVSNVKDQRGWLCNDDLLLDFQLENSTVNDQTFIDGTELRSAVAQRRFVPQLDFSNRKGFPSINSNRAVLSSNFPDVGQGMSCWINLGQMWMLSSLRSTWGRSVDSDGQGLLLTHGASV